VALTRSDMASNDMISLAMHGKWGLVEAAVAAGALDPRARHATCNTLLDAAVRWGHVTVTRVCLDAGCNPNDCTGGRERGYTPTGWAACEGMGRVLPLLVAAGGDVNRGGCEGSRPPPLVAVVRFGLGQLEAARRLQLLLNEPSVNLHVEFEGLDAATWALRSGTPRVQAMLFEEVGVQF
jgi:hypothetical protein